MIRVVADRDDDRYDWNCLQCGCPELSFFLDLNCVCFSFHYSLKFKHFSESLAHPIVDNQDCGRKYYDTDHQRQGATNISLMSIRLIMPYSFTVKCRAKIGNIPKPIADAIKRVKNSRRFA